MFRNYLSKIKNTNVLIQKKQNSRIGPNYIKQDPSRPNANFDQFSAHSPLQQSRFGSEELRSKIFFNHPPIPNRIPKFFFMFMLTATICTGYRDKIRKRTKKLIKEEELSLLNTLLPFNQAMEDMRYCALERRKYMIIKSLADMIDPRVIENVIKRYYQNDIYVPEILVLPKNGYNGSQPVASQRYNTRLTMQRNTYYDKGLFDNREIGYIY